MNITAALQGIATRLAARSAARVRDRAIEQALANLAAQRRLDAPQPPDAENQPKPPRS